MKKRIAALALLGTLALSGTSAFAAGESHPTIIFNEQTVAFPDQQPVVENGRTIVPIGPFVRSFGATADYQDDGVHAATVTIKMNTDTLHMIVLTIGSKNALVDGQLQTLDVPAQMMNDRTMVPLRFVSEGLGFNVTWDEANQTAAINTGSFGNGPNGSGSIGGGYSNGHSWSIGWGTSTGGSSTSTGGSWSQGTSSGSSDSTNHVSQ